MKKSIASGEKRKRKGKEKNSDRENGKGDAGREKSIGQNIKGGLSLRGKICPVSGKH